MPDLLCWIELDGDRPDPAGLELLGEAAEIAAVWAGQVWAAVLAGPAMPTSPENLAAELGGAGADGLLLVQHPALAAYSTAAYCAALARLLATGRFAACFAAGSPDGADCWPRLAAHLDLDLLTGCLRLAPAGPDGLRLTVPLYDGRLHSEYMLEGLDPARPLLATFRPGARGLDPPAPARPRPLQTFEVELEADPAVRSLGVLPPDPRTIDLTEAERIVAVGMGLPGQTGVELGWELAGRLGAALGGTRPVVDKGWLPFERQIGTTGRSIAPRLYIALGISGASQHTGGLRGAGAIVSVNPDRQAPMMALADLALVGDAARIVPLVVAELDARRPAGLEEKVENVPG